MRTLNIPALKLMLALSVAPALVLVNTGCSGDEKPATGDDDDDDTPVGDDDDTPTGDDDDDTVTDSIGTVDTAYASVAYLGTATVDATTYTGTETYQVAGLGGGGSLCEIEWRALDWENSDLSADPNPYNPTCVLDVGTTCDFTFTVVLDQGAESAASTDCDVFGIDPNGQPDGGVWGYGWVTNYEVPLKKTPTTPLILSGMVQYYGAPTGTDTEPGFWAFSYYAYLGEYLGFPTGFDGSNFDYTLFYGYATYTP